MLTAITAGITILGSGLRVQAQTIQSESTKIVVLTEASYNFIIDNIVSHYYLSPSTSALVMQRKISRIHPFYSCE